MRTYIDLSTSLAKKFVGSSLWRYLIIGGTTFLLDFLILVLLHEIIGLSVLAAASVSYWSSICFNFMLNNYWTFKARNEVHLNLLLYGLLLAFNYTFTIGFIAVAKSAGLHYTFAKVAAVAVSLSWTYLLYKKVVFKKGRKSTILNKTAATAKA